MKLNLVKIGTFIFLSLMLFGCTDKSEEKVNKDKNEKTEQAVSSETDDEKESDNNDSEKEEKASKESTNYKKDIGNMKVWIGGEVIVEEDKITVNGKSNVYPGSVMTSNGTSTMAIANFNENAEIEDDGSFHFEFPGYEGNATVNFKLSQLGEGEEYYGEGYQNATGPQVYRSPNIDLWSVKATIKLDGDKKMPYTIPIVTPEWQELPEDYGDTEIWIDNVEITSAKGFGETNPIATNKEVSGREKNRRVEIVINPHEKR